MTGADWREAIFSSRSGVVPMGLLETPNPPPTFRRRGPLRFHARLPATRQTAPPGLVARLDLFREAAGEGEEEVFAVVAEAGEAVFGEFAFDRE